MSVAGEHRATLGPGDHFGEIALIDDGVRSASIVAATDLLCYGLTPWEFRPFVEEHPAGGLGAPRGASRGATASPRRTSS